jgi:hypothetical protein
VAVKKPPKQHVTVAGVWFYDPMCLGKIRCLRCKYIASQIVYEDPPGKMTKLIEECKPEDLEKPDLLKKKQIDWYLHLTGTVKDSSLVGYDWSKLTSGGNPTESACLLRGILEGKASDRLSVSGVDTYWFRESAAILASLELVNALGSQKSFKKNDRVRVRTGFPKRETLEIFQPDKARGKVLLVVSVRNIVDDGALTNYGYALCKLSNGKEVEAHLLDKIGHKKKVAKVKPVFFSGKEDDSLIKNWIDFEYRPRTTWGTGTWNWAIATDRDSTTHTSPSTDTGDSSDG